MNTNSNIKVALIARPNLFTVIGGDTIQVKETSAALKKIGVNTEIVLYKNINYSKYNLLHFFNVITPEDIIGHINKSNIPYVVSTIYVSYREYDKYHRKGLLGVISKVLPRDTIEYLKTLAKFLLRKEDVSTTKFFFVGHKKSIKKIIKKSELLLPNSENEYKRLQCDYGINKDYRVIPNAIKKNLFIEDVTVEKNIVLCVARIEGQKNQLNVIKALNNTKYQVYFIGSPAPNQTDYYKLCKATASSNIHFINFIAQEELVMYYNKAKVHILASWFETTGLSNLEAAAMGCNLVVGDRGDVRDYLKDDVFYCEPSDINSIKLAVDNAWDAKANKKLQMRVIEEYTWKIAAQKTVEAYQLVLNKYDKEI